MPTETTSTLADVLRTLQELKGALLSGDRARYLATLDAAATHGLTTEQVRDSHDYTLTLGYGQPIPGSYELSRRYPLHDEPDDVCRCGHPDCGAC